MSRIFIVGDTHGDIDISKLNTTLFPDELSEALAALVKKLKQMARPWK
jgi:hypothetical protein